MPARSPLRDPPPHAAQESSFPMEPGAEEQPIPGVLLQGFEPGLELFIDLMLLLQLTLGFLP